MDQKIDASRIQRVRQEPRRRMLAIRSVEPLGASFLRITIAGDALSEFQSPGFDDHVKLTFTGRGGEELKRDMTPRHFDAGTNCLTIEIAQHDGGEATEWARQAVPGQPVTISGPKGSVVVPVDYRRQLLCGDLTGLPAIARRLEDLPAHVAATVIILAPDPDDHRAFASQASPQTHWAATDDEMIELLNEHAPRDGDAFVWCAGEATLAARVRALFLDIGHPRALTRISGYWKRDETGFHSTLERSGVEQAQPDPV